MALDAHDRLKSKAEWAADFLYGLASKKRVLRVVTHIDADGLCAGGIMAKALMRLRVPFHFSTVKYLSREVLSELRAENYDCFVFLDLGAGYLGEISREFAKERKKRVIVLDHHHPQGDQSGSLILVSPFVEGVDGDLEISAAGISYLVYRSLLGDDETVAMAIAGALADRQEVEGELRGMNSEFAKIANEMEALEIKKGLRLFGGPDYPLVPSLQRTNALMVLDEFRDANEVVKLLEAIGIPIKVEGEPTSLSDLSKGQGRDLTNEIAKRLAARGKKGLTEFEALFGDVYLLAGEPKGSPVRELSSFTTLLNACGKTGRSDVGTALTMGCRGRTLEAALEILLDYRRELAMALSTMSGSEEGDTTRRVDRVLFLLGKDRIRDTIIGTLTSIIAGSAASEETWVVIGMAESDHNMVKVSARLAPSGMGRGINLDSLMKEGCGAMGGLGGGHRSAAGGQIPLGTEESFMKSVLESLGGDAKALQ